jgi:hypothetical protein
MKAKTILYMALFCVCNSHSEYPPISQWESITPQGEKGSPQFELFFENANFASIEWYVEKEEQLVAHRFDEDYSKFRTEIRKISNKFKIETGDISDVIKVDAGWIVGINKGEFGGGVYFYSDSKKDDYKIDFSRPNQFIKLGNSILVADGLCHGFCQGQISELFRENGKWKSRTYVDLPDAANAVCNIDESAFIVVGQTMLFKVDKEKNISLLVSNAFGNGLYPNSCAIEDGYVYIGMRQFVGRYKLNDRSQKVEYLIPNKNLINKENPNKR